MNLRKDTIVIVTRPLKSEKGGACIASLKTRDQVIEQDYYKQYQAARLLLSIVDGCFSKKKHTRPAPHLHPTRTWTSKLRQVTNVGDRIFDVNVGRRTSALTVSPSWRPASARVDVPLSTYGYQHLQPGLDKVLEWKYISWWNPTW